MPESSLSTSTFCHRNYYHNTIIFLTHSTSQLFPFDFLYLNRMVHICQREMLLNRVNSRAHSGHQLFMITRLGITLNIKVVYPPYIGGTLAFEASVMFESSDSLRPAAVLFNGK